MCMYSSIYVYTDTHILEEPMAWSLTKSRRLNERHMLGTSHSLTMSAVPYSGVGYSRLG